MVPLPAQHGLVPQLLPLEPLLHCSLEEGLQRLLPVARGGVLHVHLEGVGRGRGTWTASVTKSGNQYAHLEGRGTMHAHLEGRGTGACL